MSIRIRSFVAITLATTFAWIFATAFAVALALPSTQGPPAFVRGELADHFHQSSAIAVEDPTMNGGMLIATEEIGLFIPNQENFAAEVIDIHWGILGAIIPTTKPTSFGYRIRAIYSDSPPEAFYDFGPLFYAPRLLDPGLEPKPHSHQFMHLEPAHLFRPIGGDPFNMTAWLSHGFVGSGPGNIQAVFLIGPAPTLMVKPMKNLARLPPNSPTGGTMTGLIMVLQTSVLEANASTPGAPALNLSNAIGLRAMVGPPIKIDSHLGNYGPDRADIFFSGTNIVPSLTVDFVDATGTTITQNIRIHSGSTFSVDVPPGTKTGILAMSSPTGVVAFENEAIFVKTHGVRQPLLVPGQIPVITSVVEDGETVWGFTVTGTADQLGELFGLIPPGALQIFDIEFEIYPYHPTRNFAGRGTTIPIEIAVEEVMPVIAPPSSDAAIAVQTLPILEPIGSDGVVLKTTFEDVEGDVDITFSTTMPGSTFQYMAVVRIRVATP
ncbi:MAG: hypothetical protein V3W41_07655 [Planctomycetota bacterium]